MLIVTDKYAPHAGGTAVLWSEWCRCWPTESVRVVAPQYSGWKEYDRDVRYTIDRVPYLDIPKIRMPLLWLRLFAGALRACRLHPELLHCGQILETGSYAPWIKRRYGIPYVVHTYGEELLAHSKSPHLLRKMRQILADADGVTAISACTAGILRNVVGYKGEITVVHPGVNLHRFVPGSGGDVRQRLSLPEGPLLLTAARLMQRKGIDTVIAALPAIVQQNPNVHYVIAGAGPDEARLRQLANESAARSSITFTGRVSNEDMVLLMQTADVFVHPNRELESGDIEGFGIVFLEANACCTPVIGGNSGGTPEAINAGVSGFLVDPNAIEELTDRVSLLLQDDNLRREMGAAGRRWADGFSWEASAEKVWNLSQQIIARGTVSR